MKKCIIVITILALLLGTAGFIIYITKNKEISIEANLMLGERIELTNSLKKDIFEKVKKDITEDLKAPSTAVFPKIDDWNISVNTDNIIVVKSYVDSQNSFGAMLRTSFEQKYIIFNKNQYLCIYKKINNETEFDITDRTENKKIINKNMTKNQIDGFMTKIKENKYGMLFNKIIDYTFDEETQQLEWNIRVNSQLDGDLKNNCYLELTAAIDECICMPTVRTTINAYFCQDDENKKIATVKDIDFDFMVKKWNVLCDVGINSDHLTTDLEEELAEKLVQEDIIKNMKVNYWNK